MIVITLRVVQPVLVPDGDDGVRVAQTGELVEVSATLAADLLQSGSAAPLVPMADAAPEPDEPTPARAGRRGV